jgi:hypothetical protein
VQSELSLRLVEIPIRIWLAGMVYAAYTPEHASDIGPFTRRDIYVIGVENTMSGSFMSVNGRLRKRPKRFFVFGAKLVYCL